MPFSTMKTFYTLLQCIEEKNDYIKGQLNTNDQSLGQANLLTISIIKLI